MSFLPAIVEITDENGVRVDQAVAGNQAPVRLVLGSNMQGTASTNGGLTEVRLDASGGGSSIALADHDAFRALALVDLSNNEVFQFTSPPGTFVYDTMSGAGVADDDQNVLRNTNVVLGSNGRAFNVNSSAILPTIAALRLSSWSSQATIGVQGYYVAGDDAGATYDYDPTDTTSTDNGGTIIVAGTRRYKLRNYGSINVRMFGAKGDVVFLTGVSMVSGQNTFIKSGFTAADIGKSIVIEAAGANDVNGHAIPRAGTITNVVGTTITVSFTAAQTVTSKTAAYGTNDTAAFQAAYDAATTGQEVYVPAAPGSAYGIVTEFGGTKSMMLVGAGRACTVLMWLSATAGNMYRTSGGAIYQSSCEYLQFQKMPYVTVDSVLVEDPSYYRAHQLTFGCRTVSQGGCQGNGLHFKNLLTGQVPPRGNLHISDILHTAETDDRVADNSHCIWIEGNAGEIFQQIYFSGEGNLEQCEWGIRLDYVTGAVLDGAWLIQGNRVNVHIATAGDHTIVQGGIECANAKRAITLTTLRDIILDLHCTNAHFYDPLANGARVQLDDPSYAWFGTETKLTNIPGAILRATPTITGVNGSRYGAGGYVSQYIIENTLNDGVASFRVSMKHASAQRDVYESYWDYNGNFQHHLLLAGGFESWYEGGDDSAPMGNISKSGFQSSSKTTKGDVAARARFDAIADTDEVGVIAQAGSAQTVDLYQAFNVGGGTLWRVTKDGYMGVVPNTVVGTPGLFFTNDTDTGIYGPSANVAGLVAGGVESLRWTATGISIQGGTEIKKHLNVTSSSLAFGTVTAATPVTQTVALTGARSGDTVVATANGDVGAGLVAFVWVSSNDVVSIRLASTLASVVSTNQTWSVDVWGH